MRVVATDAVRVFDLHAAVRLDDLFARRIVTGDAETRRRAGQQVHLVRFVRLVAQVALPHGRWRVNLSPRLFHHIGKLCMTAKTKLGRIFL